MDVLVMPVRRQRMVAFYRRFLACRDFTAWFAHMQGEAARAQQALATAASQEAKAEPASYEPVVPAGINIVHDYF